MLIMLKLDSPREHIQKVKDKNGKIVYVDLSTGERDSQPPLPFENGGGVQDEFYIKQLTEKLDFLTEEYNELLTCITPEVHEYVILLKKTIFDTEYCLKRANY